MHTRRQKLSNPARGSAVPRATGWSRRATLGVMLGATLDALLPGVAFARFAEGEQKALADWRAQRLYDLHGPDGWLNLVGLYPLHQGVNTFGRAATNQIRLDHRALPERAGSFIVRGKDVQFVARAAGPVLHDGEPVSVVTLDSDIDGRPTVLAAGALRFMIIARGDALLLRIRDLDSPTVRKFRGIPRFPDRPDWIVDARFEAYAEAHQISVANVLGMTIEMDVPGALVFERDGREFRLEATLESPGDSDLFVMFADATSGRKTYGAGRYLRVPMPRDGHVRIDFNRAYNPPCAFTRYATCPITPQQNRLAIAVEAGELTYPGR